MSGNQKNSFIRTTGLYLLGALLMSSLFLTSYFLIFNQITANPGKVKQMVRDSGIYQKIPAVIYDDAVDSGSTSSATLPLKSPVVRQAALDSFTPGFVQTNVENAIDGVYGWLNGQTAQPQFQIDLTSGKNNFANSLSAQLSKFPVCTPAQQAKIKNFEPFTSPCIPNGIDTSAIQTQVRQAALKSNLVAQNVVTPATIKDANGQPVFDGLKEIPRGYRLSVKLVYVFGALSLMFALGLVFGARSRRQGLKRLGRVMAAAGVFVILLPVGINWLINGIVEASKSDKVTKELVVPLVHEITKNSFRIYVISGIVYILIAVVIFIILKEMPMKLPAKIRENK